MVVQFIALGKLIYVFGIPYGDGSDAGEALDHHTTEGPDT